MIDSAFEKLRLSAAAIANRTGALIGRSALTTRQIIGAVTGVTGVVISTVHIALMLFTDVANRYHGMELWTAVGFVLAVAGILILTTKKRE